MGSEKGSSVSEASRNSAGRGKVLVVDDDAALAEMLSLVLRNEGFEAIWCGHGDKAMGAFRDSDRIWCCWM